MAWSFTGAEAAGAVLSPVVEAEEGPQGDMEDPLTIYPEGGYWALAPNARLRMLRALCCDALDTALIRCPSMGLTWHATALLASMGCCLATTSPTWDLELARCRLRDACPNQINALHMCIPIWQLIHQWQTYAPLHDN
jgi:hypothetical protein